jgi:hypothetical protein
MLRTLGCSDGLVQGRDNLRRIFEGAFELYPDLKFELLEVTPGEESLVLNYRGLGSMYTSEVMTLNSEGKITRSMQANAWALMALPGFRPQPFPAASILGSLGNVLTW